MNTSFTSKQREVLARKLGYEGPMQGFDEFLQSSPALMMRYNAVSDKYAKRMAKGGVVSYADGGLVRNTDGTYTDQSTGQKYAANAVYFSNPSPEDPNPPQALLRPGAQPITSAPAAPAPSPAPAPTPAAPAPTPAAPAPAPAPTPAAPSPAPSPVDPTKGAVTGGGNVTFDETQGRAGVPLPGQAAGITPAATPITPEQEIKDVGGAGTATQAEVTKAGTAAQATEPEKITAKTAETTTAAPSVKAALEGTKPLSIEEWGKDMIFPSVMEQTPDGRLVSARRAAYEEYVRNFKPEGGVQAVQGAVSEQAQVQAQQGYVSPESLAQAATVGEQFIQPVTAEKRETAAGELATAATAAQAPTVGAAQAAAPKAIEAAQGTVKAEELVTPAQIKEQDIAQAQAITSEGLAPDAVAVAARLDKFTVDAGTLAQAVQGDVDALSTVQGQLTNLMKSFDDGATPAWAAGAIRAANAAMASRGLGGSSMAATAIFQAAMESALPIAAQDAQVFQQINLANLNNRQQVALVNAAAQQGLSLQNLNNEQQAALQNSANSFSLQSQNLSNMQQTMLANAQLRAALQGQNLSNQQQAAVVNAARYAEMNNINLNNIQQAKLQDSANSLQVDLANLSNRQQSYIVTAQLQAALQNKNLDNLQQTALFNAARIAENNNISFNAKQQEQLHNSELMKTIGIAELNAQQATTLANAATYAAMDMADLNNRQQAAVVNAQSFLAMDMANLDREQQTTLFKSQQITQALLSDAAAENAMKQFNATSQNQVDQFMASLATQVSQFNATQKNAIEQFNTDQVNAVAKFNAEQTNARQQFNATQRLVIDQSNAQWRRDVSTADTAAVNAANYLNAQNLQQMTLAEYNNETQLYRDQIEMMWSSFEKDMDRANSIITQQIASTGSLKAAEANADGALWGAIGAVAAKWFLPKLF